jgi:hypothetical protein
MLIRRVRIPRSLNSLTLPRSAASGRITPILVRDTRYVPVAGLGMLTRAAQMLSRNTNANGMRRLEEDANASPSDVIRQWFYLLALSEKGLHAEVIRRVESGRFAFDENVVPLYVRAISQTRRLSEADTASLQQRISRAFEQSGGNNPASALRQAASSSGGGRDNNLNSSFSSGEGAGSGSHALFNPSNRSNPVFVELLPIKPSWWEKAFQVLRIAGAL